MMLEWRYIKIKYYYYYYPATLRQYLIIDTDRFDRGLSSTGVFESPPSHWMRPINRTGKANNWTISIIDYTQTGSADQNLLVITRYHFECNSRCSLPVPDLTQ